MHEGTDANRRRLLGLGVGAQAPLQLGGARAAQARAIAAQGAGLLPPTLREQYGLRWTRADGLALRASSQSCRRLLPLLPAVLRQTERLPLRLVTAFACP